MTVSIHQAGLNALATYLATAVPSATVTSAWPSPDRDPPNKAISVLMAGGAIDTIFDPTMFEFTSTGPSTYSSKWFVKSRRQPLQLDVWSRNYYDRDDLIAQLDSALNVGDFQVNALADPAGSGVLLALGDGWSGYVDFIFDGPSIDDDPDSVKRSEYRATITGDMYVQLVVTRTSAKQIQLILSETGGLFNFTIS